MFSGTECRHCGLLFLTAHRRIVHERSLCLNLNGAWGIKVDEQYEPLTREQLWEVGEVIWQ